MQIEDGHVRKIARLQDLRDCEIIRGREESEQRTGADNQRIEIGCQHTIDIAVLHQLCDTNVRPVDLGRVDISRDQVSPLTQRQFVHTGRVGLIPGTAIGLWILIANNVDEPGGCWNTCLHRTSCADKQRTLSSPILCFAQGFNQIIDRACHKRSFASIAEPGRSSVFFSFSLDKRQFSCNSPSSSFSPPCHRLDKPGRPVLPRSHGACGYTASSEGNRLPCGSDRCLDLDGLGP